MKLTVLGNNGTCPVKDGACSSFLLESLGRKILIDVGNGSLAKLQHICDLSELDGIIISHLHFDHMADLFPLKYALETRKSLGEPIRTIQLYIPHSPEWIKQEITTNNVFDIIYIDDGMSCQHHGLTFLFQQVVHIIDTFAVRVEAEGLVFVYSADSGKCSELETIAQNADLFLCESTILQDSGDGRTHHMTALDAAETARNAGVKELLLTHYFEPFRADEYAERARQVFANVRPSVILGQYEISTKEKDEESGKIVDAHRYQC